jgi:hypothetical protein
MILLSISPVSTMPIFNLNNIIQSYHSLVYPRPWTKRRQENKALNHLLVIPNHNLRWDKLLNINLTKTLNMIRKTLIIYSGSLRNVLRTYWELSNTISSNIWNLIMSRTIDYSYYKYSLRKRLERISIWPIFCLISLLQLVEIKDS